MKKLLTFLLLLSATIFSSTIAHAQLMQQIINTKAPSAGGGGATFINSAFTSTVGCAAAATSCVLTYSPTAGHSLYVGVIQSSAQTVTSVTDNGSSSYTSMFTRVSVNSGNEFLSLYCTPTVGAGVTTITSNGGGQVVMAMEFSGDSGACTLDQDNIVVTIPGASTSWHSGTTSATTKANDIAIGVVYDVTTEAPTWAGTNGYTCITSSYNAFVGNGNSMCYKILTSTGTQQATGTTSTSDIQEAIIFVSK